MSRSHTPLARLSALAALSMVLAAACGGGDGPEQASAATTDGGPGVRLVSTADGRAIQADGPADLVVLDVRTPDEFASGHLADAVLIDFYRPDFAERIAELDRDVPYLLYCRSGNRSGQAAALMADLGFTDVADVDGGVLAWADAGLPLVAGSGS